jgi:hypothetical protein
MSLNADLLIGKKIVYKYQYHPKLLEAIVLDKVSVSEEGVYDSDRMQRGDSLLVTKYLIQRINAESPLTNGTTLLITPDMVKRILD